MKKVAIVTLTKDLNYGNRLQNYAVEQLVSQHGCQPSTLFNTTWTCYGYTHAVRSYLTIPLSYIKDKNTGVAKQVAAYFDRFNRKYIHMAERYDVHSTMEHVLDQYDVFITGSDQVWNPNWEYIGEKEYLTFASGKKKIALCASFGVSTIPEEKKEKIARWLDGLDAISVREKRAAEIVKELSGRTAQVLVDPTMCIPAQQWNKMARRPLFFKKKPYVLMYVLGTMQEDCLCAVSDYCKKIHAELIILKNNKIGGNCPIGPQEYLYLIAHANYVITDSFHGSVFSILFHRNLAVFHREGLSEDQDMMSRLDTLLDRFSLKSCLMCDRTFSFPEMDWNTWKEIDAKLIHYQEEVNTFLNNNLGINK